MKLRMFLVKLALTAMKAIAPKYNAYHKNKVGQSCYVVEERESVQKMPISGREYIDKRITYMTEDFQFYTVPDVVFYKFYVKILKNPKFEVKK